jgi:hypothetical protein
MWDSDPATSRLSENRAIPNEQREYSEPILNGPEGFP